MADFDDINQENILFNGIDYTVWPLPDPVFVLPRKFLASWGPGVASELQDAVDKPLTVFFLRDRLELLRGRGLNLESIFCHGA